MIAQANEEPIDVPSLTRTACHLAAALADDASWLAEGVDCFAADLPRAEVWGLITNLATLGSQCRALSQMLAQASDDADAAERKAVR
jgi:hypothetical protein